MPGKPLHESQRENHILVALSIVNIQVNIRKQHFLLRYFFSTIWYINGADWSNSFEIIRKKEV